MLILIPALNEEESIGSVIAEIRAADLGTVSILVVDDGSTDGTRRAALQAGAEVLSLPFNLGVGGALRSGFRYAQRHGHDLVVQVDADGQHDPAEIPRMVEAFEGHDLLVGARFAGRGPYQASRARRAAMWLLARSLSRYAGTELTDVTSGFRIFGPRAVQLFAASLPTDYLGDTVEALALATRAGLQVGQVPIAMRHRQGGRASTGTVRSLLYLLRVGLVLALLTIRRPRPQGRGTT